MPKLTIDGQTVEVAANKRLVLAIEESGVNIGHRCGGHARCTTCRVAFDAGEPDTIAQAELDKLQERNLYGQYRLSCQILCTHDMSVRTMMTLENQEGWKDTGQTPAPEITPDPVWLSKQDVEGSDS
jgi:ferredoxin